jgi:hypothetical protein
MFDKEIQYPEIYNNPRDTNDPELEDLLPLPPGGALVVEE